jgi:PPOX class probable F420-dependent enzyme
MHLDRAEALRRAMLADHGVLATINRTGVADLVPACFAIVGDALAIPIDSVKPKGSTALGRLRNLERDPRASLLIEHWDPADWTALWWVRLSLRRASVAEPALGDLVGALRERYPQYRGVPFTDVLTFRVEQIAGWSAASP